MTHFFNVIPSFLKTLYAYALSIYQTVFVKPLSELLSPVEYLGVVGRIINWITGHVITETILGDITLFEFAVGAGSFIFIAFCFIKFVLDIVL